LLFLDFILVHFLEDFVAHELTLMVLLLPFDQNQRVDYNLVDSDDLLLDLSQFALVIQSFLFLSCNDIAQGRYCIGLWVMRGHWFGRV
jgi:hypothetical protein